MAAQGWFAPTSRDKGCGLVKRWRKESLTWRVMGAFLEGKKIICFELLVGPLFLRLRGLVAANRFAMRAAAARGRRGSRRVQVFSSLLIFSRRPEGGCTSLQR